MNPPVRNVQLTRSPIHVPLPAVSEIRASLILFKEYYASGSVLNWIYTNEAPPEVELGQLRHLVVAGHRLLAALDQVIHHISTTHPGNPLIISFRNQRSPVMQSISNANAIMSPVRHLPTELITEIVLHAIGHYSLNPKSSVDLEHGPWRFAQVSRRWRAVLVSTPSLWCSWHFLRLGSHKTLRNHRLLLEIVKTRSQNLPLSVVIDELVMDPKSGLRLVMFNESKRWKNANITCSRRTSFKALDKIRGHLPQLETLDLSLTFGLLGKGGFSGTLRAFETAPRLCKYVEDCRLYSCDVDVVIPWAQITHYSSNVPSSPPSNLLLLISNVVDCTLACDYYERQNTSLTVLHYLRSLRVPGNLQLDLITAPLLEFLSIGGWGLVETYHSFRCFIIRSQCSLQTLELGNIVSETSITKIAQLVPTLTSLSIRNYRYAPQLISCLDVDSTSPPIFSRLESLSMDMEREVVGGFQLDRTLAKMIESRRHISGSLSSDTSVARLETFSLSMRVFPVCLDTPYLSEHTFRRLVALVDSGMTVNIVINNMDLLA